MTANNAAGWDTQMRNWQQDVEAVGLDDPFEGATPLPAEDPFEMPTVPTSK